MGRISSLFARRYLSSRGSLSVINIISRVSIFAVGVPVAAMVILLSVFNGFDGLVKSMYGVFDPELVVVPAEGKVFDIASVDEEAFAEAGVESFSYLLEENVLLEYRGRQTTARLRGVDERYEGVVPVRETIAYGDYELRFGDMEQAVVGQGLAYDLGVKTALYDPLNVYAVRRGEYSSLLPIDGYPPVSFGSMRRPTGRMCSARSVSRRSCWIIRERLRLLRSRREEADRRASGKNWRRDWATISG